MKNGKYPGKWAKKSAALPREWQSGGGKAAQRRTKESAVPPHVYLKEQFRFRVIENNHKTKILEFVDEDTGITYTYYLKKW